MCNWGITCGMCLMFTVVCGIFGYTTFGMIGTLVGLNVGMIGSILLVASYESK